MLRLLLLVVDELVAVRRMMKPQMKKLQRGVADGDIDASSYMNN